MISDHQYYLAMALKEAQKRQGFCAPNPAVGAIIVKDGKVLSKGLHWGSGHPHAEVDALEKLGEEANGAILYVTLEPCCHYGKTPPCTDLIIRRKIAAVYFGMQDPNPKVSGKGQAILQAAGILAEFIPTQDIQAFYASYAYWMQTKKPYVTAKIALSQDGKIAGNQGEPIQITAEQCALFTHRQRKKSDAILTTINTIIHDDPQLNARIDEVILPKPIYLLDSECRLPLDAKIIETSEKLTIFYYSCKDENKLQALKNRNITCIPVDKMNDGLSLNDVLAIIGEEGVHDLWVEAGGRCFQAFFEQALLNRAYIYIAPKKLGPNAKSAFTESFDITNSQFKIQWRNLGEDLCCELEFPRHCEERSDAAIQDNL